MLKYRVHYTEFERGWGSRPDGYKDFDTYEEAWDHYIEFNGQNTEKAVPDWYMIAGQPVRIK